ncbi:alpha-mannosidase [Jeotgalibacillus haloalkalitolerans]|uniref:Alpha-mannosidase n=1 Tax=Jeotgalibacillus haloalkalitolerans TaxID=3104292 RepID=A0ABU5KJV3_9BACL|nr:alpha-mannosidase [Jeotgalibacillus sp. HH7-29]MDZ5711419.1 alpha-mannosidase [Jeotgalibacillus sp. HH7-29]
MTKKTAHIISHSHWDREWYMSLEEHRYYLVQLFDDLLTMLKDDPDYHSFHLDGQTIMVDDYLQVRPDRKEEVEKYIHEGRLVIGPWYILQDAFLTSAEANIRNLLYGMKTTRKYGQDGNLGYFPDTFGVYGQAPQILKQAGIDTAAFGRGVTPTGFNNQVFHDDYSSPYSEMTWEAPDGSQVLGILFANWYSNGNEIPSDGTAEAFWDQKLRDAERFASTSELLFMNGCDHQPVQKDITKAIKIANELRPEIEFRHSSFQDYIAEVKKDLPNQLQVVKGELRNQKTDGWSTLVNTASARIYLKQANDRCQTLLEKVMEPLGCFAEDQALHSDFTEYYWKLLMENHPHDSICGCSVDHVHQEMETRFMKVETGVQRYIDEQLKSIAEKIDTTHQHPGAIPLLIMNTAASREKQVIRKVIHLHKIYFSEKPFQEIPALLQKKSAGTFYAENGEGEKFATVTKDNGIVFGYDLPDDGFRRPYYAIEAELTFEYAPAVAAGYEVYYLIPEVNQTDQRMLFDQDKLKMENEFVKVMVHENGTYTISNQQTGVSYPGLGIYEDTGDIGNEYMFKETGDGFRVRSEKMEQMNVIENNGLIASIEIIQSMKVPAHADDQLQEERQNLVWHPERKSGRSNEMTNIQIKTTLTLEKHARGLMVSTVVDNQAKDHRLRVLFPAGSKEEFHLADSVFEVSKRPNVPEKEWKNPAFDHHMQRFVSLNGLTVAGKGLHEYEVSGQDTIELTLLRSVGELGDWGVFETPEAQSSGEQSAEYMVIPDSTHKAFDEAYRFPIPAAVAVAGCHSGNKSKVSALFEWQGEGLILTSIKPRLQGEGTVIRWFNPSDNIVTLEVDVLDEKEIYHSTVLEKKAELLGSGRVNIEVKPYEIMTLLVSEGDKRNEY